ncbi:dephospho-CoA kinase [Thermanaerovibrio acidaminovorans DSM 6589]|uniref:Dephospho-CoA kinase n=1 Tax=Thermanaerovibrio acidaminovorans (strain ATCC 49978 / DSM 6589 / Su883) TaxID=525903 RepID=D1B9M9_THEAS|nr:dephospho-CoA kinase [Thermanaerovibrio acidaminovorans DSM 6589]
MFTVALTGDVGAGKSTLLSMFARLGARTVSADLVAKGLWEDPRVRGAFADRWGGVPINPDGTLDVGTISRRVFSDEGEYRFLCAVLHPLTWEVLQGMVGQDGIWVLEVPLLFESGVPHWIDGTLFLGCPPQVRLSRVMVRGWDQRELESRERWLMRSEDKRRMADWVIDNQGSMEDLWGSALRIYQEMRLLNSVVLGNVTFPSAHEALEFSRRMVESKLAACCRVRGVDSVYRWEGEVYSEPEAELAFKTVEGAIPAIRDLLGSHPYDMPALYFERPHRMGIQLRRWVVQSCSS